MAKCKKKKKHLPLSISGMISSLNFYSVAFAVDLKRHFSWHLYAVLIIAHHSYFVAVFFIAATLPFLPFFATALTVSLCAEC